MTSATPDPAGATLESVRLDVWLDVACVFPTRSAASRAIKGGKVSVNDEAAKPNKPVRIGDRIEVRSPGRRRILEIRGVAEKNVPRAEARALYDDQTPPPTAEEVAMRRALRRDDGAGRPTGRERRVLRKLRGR